MICGFALKKIPDFLLDYTLLPKEQSERLPEHGAMWRKFLQRMWTWQGSTFCFRFVFQPETNRTHCFLLARPAKPDACWELQADLDFALKAFGIFANTLDFDHCVPLLKTPEVERSSKGSNIEGLVDEAIKSQQDIALRSIGNHSVIMGLVQRTAQNIWNRGRREIKSAFDDGAEIQAWIPQIWNGPKGSFLLPFRSLYETRNRTILSVYAQPTQLDRKELGFIDIVRSKSLVRSQHQEDPDLGAEQLARIANNCYLRLLSEPWLVAVDCVSTGGNTHEAKSVLASVAASVHKELDEVSPGEFPAAEFKFVEGELAKSALKCHASLEFPTWTADLDRPLTYRRMEHLTDARGAATVFRLPTNVRGGISGFDVVQLAPDRIPAPTSMDSKLARTCDIRVRPRPTAPTKSIFLGNYESGSPLVIDANQLTKHALITGFTGSGKTTTVLQILHQLWHQNADDCESDSRKGIPFLVIEAAKTEYRGLMNISSFYKDGKEDNLLVYTVGNENCAPFRLNPFDVLPGLRIETHVNRLQACFEAALPPLPWLPSILAESLEKVYKRKHWVMTDEYSPSTALSRQFPLMKDFYKEVSVVLNTRGYRGETGENVRAATLGRLKQLLIGSTGFIFADAQGSPEIMADTLFSRPVVLELNDLNLQDKALMMMFILTLLREYRELNPSRNLSHVTVVEEAHNVLGVVESQGTAEGAGADTRAKSVEYFCNMLAEMRSLGQGLIISDQSPNKLAPDAMRNTNVQIAHQLRDGNDRDSIANAMIMDPEQRDYLGKLRPGKAAIFRTGMEKAGFVSVANYFEEDGVDFLHELPNSSETGVSLEKKMAPFVHDKILDLPFKGCDSCGHRSTCDFRYDSIRKAGGDTVQLAEFVHLFERIKLRADISRTSSDKTTAELAYRKRQQERNRNFKQLLMRCRDASESKSTDAIWCLFLHLNSKFGAELEQEREIPLKSFYAEVEKLSDHTVDPIE